MRGALLDRMSAVVVEEGDVSEESLWSWTNSIASVVQNHYEVAAADVDTLYSVVSLVLDFAMARDYADYAELPLLLEAIDAMAVVPALDGASSATLLRISTIVSRLIQRYHELVIRQVVPEEGDVSYLQSSFRMTSASAFGNDSAPLQVYLPQTEMERFVGLVPTSVQLRTLGYSNDTYVVSLVNQWVAPYSNTASSTISSNPTTIMVTGTGASYRRNSCDAGSHCSDQV